MTFDWTISLGTIIHLGVLVTAIAAAFFNIKGDVRDIRTKVELMWRPYAGGEGLPPMDTRVGILEHEVANLKLKSTQRT